MPVRILFVVNAVIIYFVEVELYIQRTRELNRISYFQSWKNCVKNFLDQFPCSFLIVPIRMTITALY